jgi:hypothetical protein
MQLPSFLLHPLLRTHVSVLVKERKLFLLTSFEGTVVTDGLDGLDGRCEVDVWYPEGKTGMLRTHLTIYHIIMATDIILLNAGTFVAVAALVFDAMVDNDGGVTGACRTSFEDRPDAGAEPVWADGAIADGHNISLRG